MSDEKQVLTIRELRQAIWEVWGREPSHKNVQLYRAFRAVEAATIAKLQKMKAAEVLS